MEQPKPLPVEAPVDAHPRGAPILDEPALAEIVPEADALTGEVAFASAELQAQRRVELLGADALVVVVPPLPATSRGRLAEHVGERIERELAARGAPSPYLAAWSAMPEDAESRLADQLFRARTVGASGIAIAMGTLAWAAEPALSPEDSATVQLLARAARSAPVVLLLDDGDAFLRGYAAPVSLASLVAPAAPAAPATARVVPCAPPVDEAAPEPSEADLELTAPAPPVAPLDVDTSPALEAALEDEPELVGEPEEEPVVAAPAEPEEPRARRRVTAGVPVAGASDAWRAWALALGAARGPQPPAAFERLFVESYVPLAHAIAAGLDDARALRAYDEFRRTFERSYTDAFATFGVTSRRPRLVMDAYDVASRQARLHNARSAHVLVVDSMRHDLGSLVRDKLARRTAGVASLTSESLLWSALPTTTMRQLETLARGLDALRAPATDDGAESLRGRSAEHVRRMRVGSRELYKLDVVPAMLGAGAATTRCSEEVVSRFDAIAETAAESIAQHLEALAPRTLLLVLGDHGFCIDRRGRITHGGAAPEEVLVPAYAWLVGELH